MKKTKHLTLFLIWISILTGCSTLTVSEDEISIRHSSENNLLIDRKAEKHCAQYDKKAVQVQRSPVSYAYFAGSVVTTYKCVKAP